MPLLIGGKTREQHVRDTLIGTYGKSRLNRLPAGTIIPPRTTPQQQAEFCRDHASKVLWSLMELPTWLRRVWFLSRVLNNPDSDDRSDDYKQAQRRFTWYRAQVRADLLEIVRFEHRADLNWRFLEPQERAAMGCGSAWQCDVDRESLIGLVYCSGHSWVSQYLGESFDLKRFVGFIPDLSRGVPYRYDLAQYIQNNWLDGDPGQDPEGKWKKSADQREAIVARARSKANAKWSK